MRSRHLLWGGVGVVGAAGAIGGAWMLSLPAARVHLAAAHRIFGNAGSARGVEATKAWTPRDCQRRHQQRDGDH
jgi:hypothetical protein